jgi:hypothetical protein
VILVRAIPYRAELRTSALRGAAAISLIAGAAVALYVAAGRFDLNVDAVDAALIAGGALVAAVIYSRRGERLGRRLERLEPLDPAADRRPPGRIRWGTMPLQALGLGLIVGGIGLVIDFELDVLALVLAIGLGGVVGADLLKAFTLARYERAHRGTVYRVEDPPGTEAGLGWAAT